MNNFSPRCIRIKVHIKSDKCTTLHGHLIGPGQTGSGVVLRLTPLHTEICTTASSGPLGADSLFLFSRFFINPNFHTKQEKSFFPLFYKPQSSLRGENSCTHVPQSTSYQLFPIILNVALLLMLTILTISQHCQYDHLYTLIPFISIF